MKHLCASKLTPIGSDNGLSHGRTNAGILLIGPLGTNFSEMLIEIYNFHSGKCMWICRLRKSGNFVSASMCLVYPMARPYGRRIMGYSVYVLWNRFKRYLIWFSTGDSCYNADMWHWISEPTIFLNGYSWAYTYTWSSVLRVISSPK